MTVINKPMYAFTQLFQTVDNNEMYENIGG